MAAITIAKVIVILVLWMCLIGVGYLTSKGIYANTLKQKETQNELANGNWFDSDSHSPAELQATGFISAARDQTMNREQRWIASSTAAVTAWNKNKDENPIFLNGHGLSSFSLPSTHFRHGTPTLDPDSDLGVAPTHGEGHEPLLFSLDEKYQIVNDVEEIQIPAAAAATSNVENGNGNGDDGANSILQNWKHKQDHDHEAENSTSDEDNDDGNNNKRAEQQQKSFTSVKDGILQATLLHHLQEQQQQFFLQQKLQFKDFMAKLNSAAGKWNNLMVKCSQFDNLESRINQQFQNMDVKMAASLEKFDSVSMDSQIILKLSKESFLQMNQIQETADDILFHIRGLKKEVDDVGQTSVQAIYNIQKSEENLMKQLGESWNRTIYALRQEPAASSADSSTTYAWNSEQHQMQQQRPKNQQKQQEQGKHDDDAASSSLPSPTLFQHQQQTFIQADDASSSSINRATTTIASQNSGLAITAVAAIPLTATTDEIHVVKARRERPKDCTEIQLSGNENGIGNMQSGLFNIYPFTNSSQHVQVYCDLDSSSEGGGWTVIQRRGDYQLSRENFQRTWQDYEKGFGSPYNHFWIGLTSLAALTQYGDQILRIELTDWDGAKMNANYGYFRISNASDLHRLHVTDFSGTAGDSLTYHNRMPFTTMDNDNDMDKDINCAQRYRGGWWYRNCHQANLNGLYLEARNGKTESYGIGINWYTWYGYYYSLKHVEMKIRKRNLNWAE